MADNAPPQDGIRLVDPKTGQPIVARTQDLAQVISSGQAQLPNEVEVRGADGKRYAMPSEGLAEHLERGTFSLVTDNELAREEKVKASQGVLGSLATGLLGAVSGATLGASDYLANKTGLATTEERDIQREANPAADVIGNLAGGIGTGNLLASGAKAALGRAGVQGAKAVVLGEGIAGGTQAGTSRLFEELQRNPDKAIEDVAVDVLKDTGSGFALGAGLTGAGMAAVGGAKAGARYVASKVDSADLAANAALGGITKSERGAALRGFGEGDGRKEFGEILLRKGVFGGDVLGGSAESLRRAKAAKDATGLSLEAISREADDVLATTGATFDQKALRDGLLKQAREIRSSGIANDKAAQLEKLITGFADQLHNPNQARDAVKGVLGDEVLWAELSELGADSKRVRTARAKLDKLAETAAESTSPVDELGKTQLDLGPKRSHVSAHAAEILGPVLEGLDDAGKAKITAALDGIETASRAPAGKQLNNSEIWAMRRKLDEARSMFDGGETVGKEFLRKARADFTEVYGRDLERVAGPEIAGRWKQGMKEYSALALAEDSLETLAQRAGQKGLGSGLGGAAVGGVVGMALGGNGLGGAILGAAGQGLARSAADIGSQLLPRMAHAAEKRNKAFDTMVKGLTGVENASGDGLKGRAVQGAKVVFSPRLATNGFIAEQRAHLEEVAREGSEHDQRAALSDPDFGPLLAKKQREIAQHLLAEAPQPYNQPPDSLWARFDEPKYTKEARESWAAKLRAATDPIAVLDKASRGKATTEELQTVAAVYPILMDQARTRIMAEVARMTSKPSAQQQRAIESFLGTPKNVAKRVWLQGIIQSGAHGAQTASPKQSQGAGASNGASGAKSFASGSDSIEAGIGG